ncbi:MAG: UvrD-helicase domain-containing protein [Clostridiales bacterium]|nr:UvrD-helicase domain-containing protein [Clostridiales bacterium]
MERNDFLSLRRRIIENDFKRMNDMQKKAVFETEGPLLILAGAGSGKTTVLVNRIANLIKYGSAYNSDFSYRLPTAEDEEKLNRLLSGEEALYGELTSLLCVDTPKPWQILAITFTNKAANELKNRLEALLGPDGLEVNAGTFHSACVRILRRDGGLLGYTKHFTIYDTDDSKRVMKECQRQLGIDDKEVSHKHILSEISKAKDTLVSPADFRVSCPNDRRSRFVADAYEKYQAMLKAADAMDFDDIIVNTVELLRRFPEVLEYYKNKYRYVMVDEYQDTNHAQYVLTSLLASGHNNICVVGDDDQSIYKFRGATIENILSFEKQYKNAQVIRLEQNYRSTQVILDAANAVISNNTERKGKELWTAKQGGDKITLYTCADDLDEGRYIADEILNGVSSGSTWGDFAVLYRMNAQSNSIERAFVRAGVPYRVIGGHRFYERKEIKDALAYLAVICNPSDDVRLRRIINEPKRGIGDTTVNMAAAIAGQLGTGIYSVISRCDEYAALSRASAKLREFTALIDGLRESAQELSIAELFKKAMEDSGYLASLSLDRDTCEERIANINELSGNLIRYIEENGEGTLEGFLEEVALMSDIDNYNSESDAVVMMTLHSAKGLEFPCVFIAGMENGIFPGNQVMYGGDGELQEERRLAYVGITRAKQRLYLTNARSRLIFGSTTYNMPSSFLKEIPEELLDVKNDVVQMGFGGYQGSEKAYTAPKRSYHFSDTDSTSVQVKRTPISHNSEKTRQKSADWGFSGAASSAQSAKKNAPQTLYKVGDTVAHKAFGTGMILKATPMGNDVLLEIAFDKSGTKKLMGKTAPLEKL